jgi:hypothetical protein
MICAACGAEQPDPPGRFCAACALALPVARPKDAPAAAGAPAEVRCSECGIVATGPRCRGCGAKVRWPED